MNKLGRASPYTIYLPRTRNNLIRSAKGKMARLGPMIRLRSQATIHTVSYIQARCRIAPETVGNYWVLSCIAYHPSLVS